MNTLWVVAGLTVREAARRRILWVALGLSLLFLLVYWLGYQAIASELRNSSTLVTTQANNFMVLAGLYVVNFLVLMMTVLASVDTLSGEIASGTIHTLVTKPLHRWQVLMGKWFGLAGMLSLYLVLMAGGVLVIGAGVAGYVPSNAERGFGLLWLNCLILLSLTFLGGALLSTLANGVLAFGLYGIAFVGGWIESVGSLLHNDTAVQVGIVSSLLLPSEALWRRASYEMQTVLAGAFGFSPFSSASVPSPAMVVYAALYGLAALALALRAFSARDL